MSIGRPVLILGFLAILSTGCDDGPGPGMIPICEDEFDCLDFKTAECEKAVCVSGECQAAPDSGMDGLDCGVADLCVIGKGICSDGVCEGARRVSCPAVPCMTGSCDSDTGSCVYRESSSGAPCDTDRNPCTIERCEDGRCVAESNDCPCRTIQDCPVPSDRCFGDYICQDGFCEIDPMSVVVCPASGLCDYYSCNETTGECERALQADGTSCAPADACNGPGACDAGECVRAFRCDDDNPCTGNECDPVSGACSYPAIDAVCDDNDPCTAPDVCRLGKCTSTAISCDDFNDCTDDRCVSGTGCENTPVKKGTPCVSSDLCVSGSVCDGLGTCGGGVDSCDDGNPCTADSCDPDDGSCSHTAVSGDCDDNNLCTVGETCLDKVCQGGEAVPGCCNFASDCDDYDMCTVSDCLDGVCVHHGEPAGICAASDRCVVEMCRSATGLCGQVDAGFPVHVVAWDFQTGQNRPGFVWSDPPGRVDSAGLSAAVGRDSAVFRLPGRIWPMSVFMVSVEMASGDCGAIGFSAPVSARGCLDSGRVVVAAFDGDSILDDDGRLNLAVSVTGTTTVRRVDAWIWAVPGCDSPGRIIENTSSATELSISAVEDSMALVFSRGSATGTWVSGLEGYALQAGFLQDPFSVVSDRFSTSVTPVGDGWLAAWGSANDAVQTGFIDRRGNTGQVFTLPAGGEEQEVRAWPSVATDPDGRAVLTWAYGTPTDFDIALAVLGEDYQNQSLITEFSPVNETSIGNQIRPTLALTESGGLIVWEHDPSPSGQYRIEAQKFDYNLQEVEQNFVLATSFEILALPKCIYNSKYFCIWSKADGGIGGAVIDAETLQEVQSFPVGGSGDPRTRPVLVASEDKAILVSIAGSGATASIVAQTVSVDGQVSEPVIVAGPVLAGLTHFSVASWGPAMFVLAWTDLLSETPGVRVVVFSPACDDGFLVEDRVCTGLGPDGRDGGTLQ